MPDLVSDSPSAAPRAGRGALLTIFLIVFVDLMGFGIVLPNLQLYGLTFGISNYFALTLIGATYSIFQFIFAPLLGRWSDRIGRRPVLLVSQAGTLLGFLMLFAAHKFTGPQATSGIILIYLSRVIDGISGGNISTASAYVADITSPENRAKGMGMIGAAFGLGFVFGPMIGGVVGKMLGLQYVPLAAATFSVLALFLTYTKLPESLKPGVVPDNSRRFSILGLQHALSRPKIRALILIFFLNGFAFAAMEQTLSLLIALRVFGIKARSLNDQLTMFAMNKAAGTASLATGFLFGFIGIIIVFIQGGMIHRLTKRFGAPALVFTGPALIAAGLVVVGLPIAWAWPWTGFVIGCAFLALGSSLFNPSVQALISQHAPASEQGEIMGANQGMASLARALGPMLGGILFQYVTPGTPYYVAAGLTGAVAIWALVNQHRLQPPEHDALRK